jgi:hypothetical protein
MNDKMNRNRRINHYLIINATFIIIVLVLFIDSMVERGFFLGVIGFLGLILTPMIRKSLKTNQLKRESMLTAHGEDVIIAKGDDYFGMVSTEKRGQALVLLIYLVIILVCLTFVYDVLEMSIPTIIIVDALHVLLLSPIFFILKEGLLQTAIFTSSSIIVRDAATIDLQSRFKYQFFELMDGKYILEINSGERFQRFCLDKDTYSKIADLFN